MWGHAKSLIQSQLRDFDVKFLTDAVQSMLRDEGSTLREWVQMFIRLKVMCTAKGVTYPPAHWAKQLLGQVASNEKTDGKFKTLPKDESAYGAFDMGRFEKEILNLAQGTLPPFKQANVRAHVLTLLVDPTRVEKLRKSKNNARATANGEQKEKYCKSCECKHAKGKHTPEGKKRYQESKKKTAEDGFSVETNRRSSRKPWGGKRERQAWRVRCCKEARQVQRVQKGALPVLPGSAWNMLRVQEGPQTFLQTGPQG